MTAEGVAKMILLAVALYAAAGLAFALAFIIRGVGRIDPVAGGSRWGFRLLILPGSAALWPVLALKWWRARGRSRP